MAQSYLIGVDTGGTYTDAAVIEAAGHKVIASAKALTTKGDLAIGVSEAITKAIAALPRGLAPGDISLVSVSTTLATNAVVEGHGSPVGVILIGFDQQMAERTGIAKAFPGMPVALIDGGHDHNGDERAKLDQARLADIIREFDPKVDAFAVAASFAVRNPAHEVLAREIITAKTGKPVTISSELSSALDAPRRALTAALNARLISRISRLIEAVGRAMKQLGIACPLMIVKGDGTLALAETVALRPIETVMSGPAASLVGARWLSGLDSFIMSDMGGTTTDLGIVVDGRLQIADEGAEIGGWRTMVKAADVRTVGLGGDSEVHIGMNGAITVGPGRIVPLSLLGSRFPEMLDLLGADLADNEGGSLHGKFVLRPFGSGTREDSAELSAREREIMEVVGDRPIAIRKVALSSGAQRSLNGLRRKGLVQLCGFTPSDAAHVLGLQDNWSAEAALLGAQLCARFRDMKAPSIERGRAFAQDIWNETVRLSARAVVESALGSVCT
ncbi:MAG: hydantoinase/oxoprolinase family protein [Hyphomicrobiales bacterium]